MFDDFLEAALTRWQNNCGTGWGAASCFNGFWGYSEVIRGVTSVTRTQNNVRREDLFGGALLNQAVSNILTSPLIPYSTDRKSHWATINSGTNELATNNLLGQATYSYTWNGVTYAFLVLSVDEKQGICESYGKPSTCNLTTLP